MSIRNHETLSYRETPLRLGRVLDCLQEYSSRYHQSLIQKSVSQKDTIDERKIITQKLDFYRKRATDLFRIGVGTIDDLVDYERYTLSNYDLFVSLEDATSFGEINTLLKRVETLKSSIWDKKNKEGSEKYFNDIYKKIQLKSKEILEILVKGYGDYKVFCSSLSLEIGQFPVTGESLNIKQKLHRAYLQGLYFTEEHKNAKLIHKTSGYIHVGIDFIYNSQDPMNEYGSIQDIWNVHLRKVESHRQEQATQFNQASLDQENRRQQRLWQNAFDSFMVIRNGANLTALDLYPQIEDLTLYVSLTEKQAAHIEKLNPVSQEKGFTRKEVIAILQTYNSVGQGRNPVGIHRTGRQKVHISNSLYED